MSSNLDARHQSPPNALVINTFNLRGARMLNDLPTSHLPRVVNIVCLLVSTSVRPSLCYRYARLRRDTMSSLARCQTDRLGVLLRHAPCQLCRVFYLAGLCVEFVTCVRTVSFLSSFITGTHALHASSTASGMTISLMRYCALSACLCSATTLPLSHSMSTTQK